MIIRLLLTQNTIFVGTRRCRANYIFMASMAAADLFMPLPPSSFCLYSVLCTLNYLLCSLAVAADLAHPAKMGDEFADSLSSFFADFPLKGGRIGENDGIHST